MQFKRLILLIALCVASMLGLASLGIPEQTTMAFTTTEPVAATSTYSSITTITPETTQSVTIIPCIGLGNFACVTYSQGFCFNGTCYVGETYTTTASSIFIYTSIYSTTTTQSYTPTYYIPLTMTFRTSATYTWIPTISTQTAVSTSTVTTSLTQTSNSTSQQAAIFTNNTNQMVAAVLAAVLVLSITMIIRESKKKRNMPSGIAQ